MRIIGSTVLFSIAAYIAIAAFGNKDGLAVFWVAFFVVHGAEVGKKGGK